MLSVLFSHQSAAQAYGSVCREIQATVSYENNINRTYLRDELDDRISSISVGGGHVRKVNLNAQLVLSGYATVNRYEAWDDWTIMQFLLVSITPCNPNLGTPRPGISSRLSD